VVIHYRSLTAFLLGAWLGAAILADVAVTQNFQAVDRFLPTVGMDASGRASQRVLMRRNAADENAWIFMNWERAQFVIGALFVLLLWKGGRAGTMALPVTILVLGILVAEHFLLTPQIIALGGNVDRLPQGDVQYRKFWILHGLYSGLDILKMLLIFGLAAHDVWTRKQGSPESAING